MLSHQNPIFFKGPWASCEALWEPLVIVFTFVPLLRPTSTPYIFHMNIYILFLDTYLRK